MGRIVCQETFEIGVKAIDHQHKKIFELIDLFFETAQTTLCPELAVPILRGLIRYMQSHFETEEDQMRKMDYPELVSHQQQHRHMQAHLSREMNQDSGQLDFNKITLALFLKHWLAEHIEGSDQKIGLFLKQEKLF